MITMHSSPFPDMYKGQTARSHAPSSTNLRSISIAFSSNTQAGNTVSHAKNFLVCMITEVSARYRNPGKISPNESTNGAETHSWRPVGIGSRLITWRNRVHLPGVATSAGTALRVRKGEKEREPLQTARKRIVCNSCRISISVLQPTCNR